MGDSRKTNLQESFQFYGGKSETLFDPGVAAQEGARRDSSRDPFEGNHVASLGDVRGLLIGFYVGRLKAYKLKRKSEETHREKTALVSPSDWNRFGGQMPQRRGEELVGGNE